ncbi:MAG: efflux RND transporter permease subunit [Gammaproteobacteria bacterium]|nr:efflux RND transporter permease subunit [Gammaproteobacteria bacterium]
MNTLQEEKGLIAWFANNHVAANLMMIVIIMAGLFSVYTITKKAMPDFDLTTIQITMAYPGATPGDVERGIIILIEEAVEDVDGVTDTRSVSREGSGTVTLEVDESYDINEVLNDVKTRVDGIINFPVDAEPAAVSRTLLRNDALRIEVYGDIDAISQKELAQELRDELLELSDVTAVRMAGDRPYEIGIEVSENTLLKYGLSLDQIAQRIRASSLDLPAGSIDTEGGEILVRTQAIAYDYHDFDKIVLLTTTDGTILTLGDIATIVDGFEDIETYARFDGKPSISLTVLTTSNQNMLQVAQAARTFVDERQQTLPEGINLDVWADSSFYLQDRLDLMTSNLLMGAFLVLIILSIFLEIKLAFWVVIGIPISFLGAFALMPSVGLDMNMLSLFGFIMVLGIVVDDAIIIGESAHHSMTKYGHSTQSIVHGANRVALPATFGVLTTIVAFMPLLMISGFAAAFTESIGWVVILCLVFSLIESKLILPSHLVHFGKPNAKSWFNKIPHRANAMLDHFVHTHYSPFVEKCIRNRYITITSFIGMFIITTGLLLGGVVRLVFLPEIPSDFIQASVTMVEGSPEQQTRAIMNKLENAALSLNGKFEFEDSETGEISTKVVDHVIIVGSGVSSGTAAIEMDKDVPSQIDADLLTQYLENYVGNMPGLKSLTFSSGQVFGGNPISYQLVSNNPDDLTAAASELEAKLRTYSGLINIKNEAVNNKDELRLQLLPRAEVMGFTLNDLSSQVRNAFYGSQAQRLQRGDDEVKVMVRYPEEERISIGDLEDMYIRTNDGEAVPFTSIADFNMQSGYAQINRVDGERSVAVNADIIESMVEPNVVNNDIKNNFFPELRTRYPSVDYREDGGTAEQQSIIQDMVRGMMFAIFGIYALLAIPLRSYTQPIMIMGVIPFGMVGAIVGHLIVGIPVNFMSFLGIIALSGVVVNDSIILVNFVNKAIADGEEVVSAVIKGGARRFRAILLTSLTTFFGLLPILLETSMQAQFLIPMATSMAFGIVFATIITLLLIPCLYVILEDIKGTKLEASAINTGPGLTATA